MKKIIVLLPIVMLFAVSASAQLRAGTIQVGSSSYLFGSPNQLSNDSGVSSAGFQFGSTTKKAEFISTGGNAGSVSEETEKYWAFNFSPSVSYFLTNHVSLGLSPEVLVYREKDDDGEITGFTAYAVAPNVRIYLKNEGKYLPHGEVRGGIVWLNTKYRGNKKEQLNFVALKSGHSFWLSDNFTLDIFAEYLFTWQKEHDTLLKLTSRSSNLGFGLGLSYFLFKKKE
jgi:hypothetical protein